MKHPALTLLTLVLVAPSAGWASQAPTAPPGPTPDGLVDQAWTLLPPYDGELPAFLAAEAAAHAQAASHLVEAALALDPEHVRALWSLGHVQTLLEEDRRNRGEGAEARTCGARSERALGRAIELDAGDPWARYARGLARTARGSHGAALEDLEAADRLAAERIEAGESQLEWLRFKVLGLRAEVRLRAGEFEAGRSELADYHAQFSTNRWPLLIALADSHLRERDLEGARRRYTEITEAFRSDHQAWALLAYVEGLLGEREPARAHLEAAIERQMTPGMYTRLWLAILSDGEARAAAMSDLAEFLENPPPGPTPWDLALGRFFVGRLDEEAFGAALAEELERRRTEAEALDLLECEAWFYVGLRREREARAARDAGADLAPALEAYRRALRAVPVAWKWEWAYARLHFAELAGELGVARGERLLPVEGAVSLAALEASIAQRRWHRPRAASATAQLGDEPRPGDLVFGVPVAGRATGCTHLVVDVVSPR